jgi:hypothetical protein
MGLAALMAGAGIGLACFGASFLIHPKEHVAEQVAQGPMGPPGPSGPQGPSGPSGPETKPVAKAPAAPVAPPPEDAPKTPEEKKFVEQPQYQSATYHGRTVKSVDGRAISFADGLSLWPAHWDGIKVVDDEDAAFDTNNLIGDLAMCTKNEHQLWRCTAMHQGEEVAIGGHSVKPGEPV